MYPVWVIATREFTQNIFSLRLLIGLIVCFALFVFSIYVLMEDYAKRLSVHNAAEIAYRIFNFMHPFSSKIVSLIRIR